MPTSKTSAKRGKDQATARAAPGAVADESAARVLRRFRQVFNAVKTHFRQVEKLAGVGGAQLWALSVIDGQPGVGIGDLATAMDIHQTTASNLVKALVALNMVSTQRSPSDRRAVQLQLTQSGSRVLGHAPGPFAGVLPDALARLDAQTLERLDHALGILLDELKPDDSAAKIPLADM